MARPLTHLLKKTKFNWDNGVEKAFESLKQAMTTTPTIAMLNFNEPFAIESDASNKP